MEDAAFRFSISCTMVESGFASMNSQRERSWCHIAMQDQSIFNRRSCHHINLDDLQWRSGKMTIDHVNFIRSSPYYYILVQITTSRINKMQVYLCKMRFCHEDLIIIVIQRILTSEFWQGVGHIQQQERVAIQFKSDVICNSLQKELPKWLPSRGRVLQQDWQQGMRYRTQGTRYRIQDTEYRIQDTGYRIIQDTRYRI